MKKTIGLAFIIMSCSFTVLSSETDGFTNRNAPLADSSPVINEMANKYMSVALHDANAVSSCDETALYTELRKYFSNHMKGQLIKDILTDESVPKRKVVLSSSVYRDWSPWDGLGMGLTFVSRTGLTVSPILNFDNTIIGADKFEHFFGQGFSYFTENYLKDKGAIKAVKGGVFKEKIFLGGNKVGNGVFSYGDLSANFNGMRFWNHMLQKNADVLGEDHNLGPYVQCENNKWVQVKKIDFTDYFDSSMDESINCSKFPSGSTVKKFEKSVEELSMNCPVDPQKLEEMRVKYGAFSKWIINLDGNGVVHYFGEFKNKK
jgi:hypothetical protein